MKRHHHGSFLVTFTLSDETETGMDEADNQRKNLAPVVNLKLFTIL